MPRLDFLPAHSPFVPFCLRSVTPSPGRWSPSLVGVLVLAGVLALGGCTEKPTAPDPATVDSEDDGATATDSPAQADLGVYDPVAARRMTMEAVENFDDGNLEGARNKLQEALLHRPAYFEAWRVLAGVEGGLGNRAAAFEALERAASSGLLAGFDRDPRLEPLRQDPSWSELVARVDVTPMAKAERIAALDQRDLVTEDVALDPVSGAYYVSSVHRKKVVRIHDGRVEDVWSGEDVWSVLGMALDTERRRLWVTTSAIPQMAGFDAEQDGRSSLVALGLPEDPTGPVAVVERHDLHSIEALGPGPILLNDVAVAGDGTVYVSDHRAPVGLFRLRPGASEPEPFGDLELRSPQGLAVDGQGRVWLADYSYGLAVFDAETGKGSFVHEGSEVCLLGIDGLAHDPASGHLIAIQNVLPPHRILRLVPSRGAIAIERIEVLERARADWAEPTLGTVADGHYVYIGASQWNRFDAEGQLPPVVELTEPLILRLEL